MEQADNIEIINQSTVIFQFRVVWKINGIIQYTRWSHEIHAGQEELIALNGKGFLSGAECWVQLKHEFLGMKDFLEPDIHFIYEPNCGNTMVYGGCGTSSNLTVNPVSVFSNAF